MKIMESSEKTTKLLIDDQPDNLVLQVKYLEELGYNIVVSQTGKAVWQEPIMFNRI